MSRKSWGEGGGGEGVHWLIWVEAAIVNGVVITNWCTTLFWVFVRINGITFCVVISQFSLFVQFSNTKYKWEVKKSSVLGVVFCLDSCVQWLYTSWGLDFCVCGCDSRDLIWYAYPVRMLHGPNKFSCAFWCSWIQLKCCSLPLFAVKTSCGMSGLWITDHFHEKYSSKEVQLKKHITFLESEKVFLKGISEWRVIS